MAGLGEKFPLPVEIKLHRVSKVLEVSFEDGVHAQLSFEFLRVFSPSAEVRGHGPGQEVLQTGKREIDVSEFEPVGHYAVRPVFTDGHDSGIYSWDYLYKLAKNRDRLWADYLAQIEAAGASRDTPPGGLRPPPSKGCGHG